MGGKWSVEARNLKDYSWKISDYGCSFMKWIFLSIYCLVKYDVVIIGKHGR